MAGICQRGRRVGVGAAQPAGAGEDYGIRTSHRRRKLQVGDHVELQQGADGA